MSGDRISSFRSRVRKLVSTTHKNNLRCSESRDDRSIENGKAGDVQMGVCAQP